MWGRSIAIVGGIALLIVIFLTYASFLTTFPTSSTRVTSGTPTPTGTSNSGASTAIEDLIAGKFPTASDKHGTGGVTVTVRNLRVLYVRPQSDGDWHVGVTDGTVAVFITEIIPANQASEGMPPVGSSIDETGIAYCDTVHETESWHGNTCWEIHPVTAWRLLSSMSSSSTQNQTIAATYKVTVLYGQNPIPRGSTQTITVRVQDSDGPVSNSTASIEVDYASGLTVHNFACVTSSDGACSISWDIGPSSTPGTFSIIVEVDGQDFDSSFSVTE